MTSPTQVSRLLTLVPYLQQRDGADLTDVAADFNVSPRQILADLEVLVMCGLPGGLPDDLIEIDLDVARSEGWVDLRNAPDLAPLRFTSDEATSLIVAVEAVREVGDAASAQAAQRVLDKLSALVEDQAGAVSIAVAAGNDEVREALAGAIGAGQQVRLVYDGVARRETTSPVVDPARVEVRDGVSYLVAWAIGRDAWRHYRLDRIAEVTATGHPVADHGEPDDQALSGGWFDESSQANAVTIDLAAEAAWVGEYFPTLSVVPLPGGAVRVSLPVSDTGWLTGLLLRLGPGVIAVDPPQAGADAIAEAKAAIGIGAA